MNKDISALRQQLKQLASLHAAGTLDTAAFEAAKAPLERKLLESVLASPDDAAASSKPRPGSKLVAFLCVSIVGLAVAGYSYTGAPGATFFAGGNEAPGVDPNASEEQQFAAAVEQLEQRLENEPENTEGWAMLARSYARMGQHEKALPAFKRTGELLETDSRLIADYADTLAVLNNRTLAGEPTKWITKALEVDPNNPKALALAGTAAFEVRDFAVAVRHWERLVELSPTDAEFLPQLQASIDEARKEGGMPASPVAAGKAPTNAAAAENGVANPAQTAAVSTAVVQGSVRLSAALAQQVKPDDTVFIFARAAEGPRMPLAIVRKTVRDLPLEFKLDDSLAMAPSLRLSMHDKIIISARVSKSGQAIPEAGDLIGESAPVANTATGVIIEISQVVKN